ncbi:MAG: hypothetical protein R6U57_12040 [Anaerolineales bacterium]
MNTDTGMVIITNMTGDTTGNKDMNRSQIEERIEEIKREIKEVKKSWPAHDASPALMQRLDDLEMDLAQAEKELKELLHGGDLDE